MDKDKDNGQDRLDRIEAMMEIVAEQTEKNTLDIAKHNEAIGSLLAVARVCLDSIQESRKQHDEDYKRLVEAQTATDEKLNILIDTVDRIVRRNGKA